MKKRVLSLFLALTLCLTLLPTSVFAEGVDGSAVSGETTAVEGGQPTAAGAPAEGDGQSTNTGEDEQFNSEADTRTEIWCKSKPDSIGRGYDGTTDGSTIPITLTFTDGTNEIELKEGTGFTAVKTFDSADAGWHTVTVEIALIGEAAEKYKLRAGEDAFTIKGHINKAYPDLTVSLSKTTCAVGEKLLPLLSVSGVEEDAAVTYYYTQYKTIAWDSEYEGSEAVPKIDDTTAISEAGTYYVYAKTAETKNYEEQRSRTVKLTVAEKADPVASVTAEDGTETTYSSFTDAWTAATANEGSTLKLLADGTLSGTNTDLNKSLTLDLNGYVLGSNGSLTVKSGAALVVTNANAKNSEKPIQTGLYLNLLVEKGGSFTCTDGGVLSLGLRSAGTGDYNIKLADGESHCTFVSFSQSDESATVDDMLKAASGMALHAGDSGFDVQIARSTLIDQINVGYKIFYVGACSGHSMDANGTCIYCGASYVASVKTSNGETTNYTSLDDALDAVKDGDTVTLQGDAESTKWHSISTALTLDLNGKTVTIQKGKHLSIRARVIVQDSSEAQTGKMYCATTNDGISQVLDVQYRGDLIIKSGIFDGEIWARSGSESTLTIEGGIFNKEVALDTTASISLSGGTFKSIWYYKGSFLDLLADDYAFFDKNDNLINASKINGSYLDNVKVQQHTHSFSNGACACGYTCPHTLVGADGKCVACEKQFAASVTVDGTVTYYDTFDSALVFAAKNNGCTLKLLADVTETTVMINDPFIFDLNGHSVDALSVDVKATIKDSGTTKGKIGTLKVTDNKVPGLTLGDLLEAGDAFKYENNTWANDSHLQTSVGLYVTVEKAPIQSVAVSAKDKNNKEVSTIAYGTTGEVTLVSICKLSETSGEKLSCAWYKLTDDTAIPPLDGATGTSYTLPADLPAGTHTYWVTFTSNGYSKSAEVTVTVTPTSLEGATVTVQNPTYNGKAQEPKVTVTLGDKTLSRDNDYTVQVTKETDAGSYKLTIKGGGNYTGEIEKDWKIEPMKIDCVMIFSAISKVYDGTAEINMTAEEWAKVLTFKTRSASGTVDVPSDAYTISDAHFVEKRGKETIHSPDAGEKYGITFKITLDSKNYVLQNYYDEEPAASKEYTQSGGASFTITKETAPAQTTEVTLYVTNDLAKTYEVDLAALLPELTTPREYGNITYSEPDVQITATGYYTTGTAKVENGKLSLPILENNVDTAGSVGNVTVKVTTTNYKDITLTIPVFARNKIIPVLAEGGTVSASDITYGQTLADSTLTVRGKVVCPRTKEEITGTFAWTSKDLKPTKTGDYTAEWTFTPAEGYEEYAAATGTVTVNVKPAQLQNVSVIQGLPTLYYTGQPQCAGVSAAGLGVCGERPEFTYSVAEDGEYTPQVPAFTDAGTHTVFYKAEAENHTTATGTFSVRIKPLPISLLSVDQISKTYDGAADVAIPTSAIKFFSKEAGRSDITLSDTALTFSSAQFTKKQEDGSYLPSPEVGGGKALSFTMTLKSDNYVFEREPEGTETVSGVFATDDTTRFTITKATAPTNIPSGMLNVINGTSLTYTYDSSKLLPAAPKGEYGEVLYAGKPSSNFETGYVVKSCQVGISNGVLTLTIDAQNGGKVGKIGSVTIDVTTDNYETFSLPVDLNAINQITPEPDGDITATDITYGDALSKSEISGKMKDGDKEVTGTFAWKDGTIKPNAGSYDAEWTFTPDASYGGIYANATGKVTVKVYTAPILEARVSEPSYTYDGNSHTPAPEVTLDGKTLVEGTDYTVSVDPQTNAGTYEMTINGIGNYHGSKGYQRWYITPRTVENPTVTVEDGVYNGGETVTPTVTVKDGETVIPASEYSVEFKDNINVGTATVTITDKEGGNYVLSEVSKTFTIKPAAGGSLGEPTQTQKYTDTSEHTYTPDWSGLPSGQQWSHNSEYSVSECSNAKLTKHDFAADGSLLTYAVSGGKAGDVITITLKASCDNYEDFTITLTITLTEKDDQQELKLTGGTTVVYGQTLTLSTSGGSGSGAVTYTVTNGTGEATIDPNGALTPVRVGSVTVTATKAGDSEYNAVTSSPVEITITQATPTGAPKYTEITTSGKTLTDAALTVEGSTLNPNDGKLEWVDDKGNVLSGNTVVEANTTYKWRFTPTNTNYTILTGEIELYHKSIGYSYYTIKATAGTGGSISPSGSVSVREGRDQTFAITPDKGYAVSNVKIDGKSVGAVKSYTFENVSRTHTIEVIFMKANGNPQTGVFVDVATGSYYEDAVDWAVENGITQGTDDTHFSPDGICTRAQAVTFLWRAAGSPEPKTNTMPFTDVNTGSYYYDAVLWAVENGITKGTSDTTFSPDATCSRAQIVTVLWRSEKSPATGTANPFADVKPTAYYADAVLWAVKEDITKGTTNTTFSPNADCTRAQIVTFLWRCKK